MGDLPHRVQPDPDGRYTVDVHVTPDGRARIGDNYYTPEEFADILRRNGDYDGRPIRLIGCDAGSNDFARRLSNEIDTPVLAPSKPAWTDSNGRVFSSDYEIGPDGRVRPKIPPNGEWDTHYPDGSSSRASDDAFTPDTNDADKHDLDPDDAEARGEGDGSDGGADDSPDDDPAAIPQPHRTEVISPNDPRFNERFVDWDRPTYENGTPVYQRPQDLDATPPDLGSPQDIDAPHRDRDHTPPGSPPRAEDVSTLPAPLANHAPLHPDTEYRVRNENGTRTTFFTDRNGDVKWVEAEPGATSMTPAAQAKSHGAGFNPDLGYPLLPDVQYRVTNFNDSSKYWDFHTDARGQTDSMTGDPSYAKSNKDRRDDLNVEDQDSYGAQGRARREGFAAYDDHPVYADTYRDVEWDGGHLAANQSGGPGEYVNMFPQMTASNRGNSNDSWIKEETWRAQERELAKFAKNPNQEIENYQVRMDRDESGVPEQVTMRWQEVSYSKDADGNVLEHRVTKQKIFLNEPDKVIQHAASSGP